MLEKHIKNVRGAYYKHWRSILKMLEKHIKNVGEAY